MQTPLAQVVEPVHPVPPHCPYRATLPVAAEVVAAFEVVDVVLTLVAKVVGVGVGVVDVTVPNSVLPRPTVAPLPTSRFNSHHVRRPNRAQCGGGREPNLGRLPWNGDNRDLEHREQIGAAQSVATVA